MMMFSMDTNLDNALLNVRESVDQVSGFLLNQQIHRVYSDSTQRKCL